MIKNDSNPPFRIAMYGMDPRSSKNMEMYLKGPCQGIAVVVGEKDAEIDMIDADFYKAREIIETRRALTPNRPIILLSIQNLQIDNAFIIKKPITVAQLETVFAKIRILPNFQASIPNPVKKFFKSAKPQNAFAFDAGNGPARHAMAKEPPVQPAGAKQHGSLGGHRNTARHAAVELNEGGFTAFLGTLSDVDFNDKPQLLKASYDKKHFFLGFVQSAVQTARQQSRALKLKSIWKVMIIFPGNREIWLDADDKQLRAFAGIKINYEFAKSLKLLPVDAATLNAERDPEKYQDMDAFLWKLAIWTSKGRYPADLDIQHPVKLKRWPNFSRLVITPDALRIAALMARGPILPLDAVGLLNTKPQYVFVFISACHTLGLLEQCVHPVSRIDEGNQAADVKKVKKGLLGKILGKLRGG